MAISAADCTVYPGIVVAEVTSTCLLYTSYSDVTEQRRMEQYFQNTLKNLPGGVVVVRYEKDGSIVPEYISEGLAVTTGMTLKDTWELYQEDALTGVHPDDLEGVRRQLDAYLVSGKNHWEIEYRLDVYKRQLSYWTGSSRGTK